MKKIRVTTIVGAPFIGSTALGNLVNNLDLPSVRYLGELDRLPKNGGSAHPGGPANCHLHGKGNTLCFFQPASSALDSAENTEDAINALAMLLSPHDPVLIDGSKNPLAIEGIQKTEAHEKRALLLLRDPVEWVRKFATIANQSPHQAAASYRDIYYDGVRRLAVSGIPFAVAWTHNRRFHFGHSVEQLGALLDWITFGNAGKGRSFEPTCQLGGNKTVQGVGDHPVPVFSSDEAIAAITDTPGLHDLLGSLGYFPQAFAPRAVLRSTKFTESLIELKTP